MSLPFVSSLDNNNFLSESRRLLKVYDDAVKQLRVPFADQKFYEACFVSPVREQFVFSAIPQHFPNQEQEQKIEKQKEYLLALRALCAHLEAHRITTLRVLQLCQHRNELVTELMQYCEDYENGKSGSSPNGVEPQIAEDEIVILFLERLKEHRLVTLMLVEAIFNWREQLSRPFSFNVSGVNYIYRILEDCAMVDASRLGVALNLRLREYPLGSCDNYTHKSVGGSQKHIRYADKHLRSRSNNGNGHSPNTSATFLSVPFMQGNPSLCRRSGATVLTGKHKLRLGRRGREKKEDKAQNDKERFIWGEAVIKGEHVLQQQLLSELKDMAEEGFFVTLLAMPDILQNCDRGLPLSEDCTEAWRKRILIATDNHLMGSVGSQQRVTSAGISNYNKGDSNISAGGMVFSDRRPSAYSSLGVVSSSQSSSSPLPSSPSSSSCLPSLSSSLSHLSKSSPVLLSPQTSPET